MARHKNINMKIQRFNDFVNEYKKFGDFEGALRFGDWSDFSAKLKKATDAGFSTVDDLLNAMDMDKDFYSKVRHNMIDNWIDSVSKSLLHGISGVDLEIPEKGDVIFKDAAAQTRFIIVAGPGLSHRNMFGSSNVTKGLGLWGTPSLKEISSGKSPFAIKADTPLTLSENRHEKLNELLQYVWIYVFYNDYLKKSKDVKLPKALYRGIRISNLYNYTPIKKSIESIKTEESGDFRHERAVKTRMDAVIKYITDNGISDIVDGNYLSFTSTLSIAEYFANSEGIIIKVDPNKVRVVTSPLTDEEFAEPNPVTGKKEQEYIVMVPDNYKLDKDDIIISSEDYLIGAKSPLAVAYFGHNDKKAEYDFTHNGKVYHIEAWFAWSSNTKGGLRFNIDGKWTDGIRSIKKEFGFDPTPTEKNLSAITNFNIKPRKSW